MAGIKIENAVGTTQIIETLNTENLGKITLDSKYNPEEILVLIIHFSKLKTVAMLFPNGEVAFTGPKKYGKDSRNNRSDGRRVRQGGIKIDEKTDIKIHNAAVPTAIEKNHDLKSIANSIKSVEYSPEHFPGLIYKTNDPNTVILLFDLGKIVGNGTELEEISTAINKMTNQISSLGIL